MLQNVKVQQLKSSTDYKAEVKNKLGNVNKTLVFSYHSGINVDFILIVTINFIQIEVQRGTEPCNQLF